MSYQFNITTDEGFATSVFAFIGFDKPYIAGPDHPSFAKIIHDLIEAEKAKTPLDDNVVRALFSLEKALSNHFEPVSERITVNNGRVFFDYVEVDNALTKAMIAFYEEGLDEFTHMVNFFEKIETNPWPHSREHLYRWLAKHRFAIAPDGDFIAYKGVQKSSKQGYKWESINAGTAMVNGELWTGNIPTSPGMIVEMPRDQVQFDPAVGCATGLHAGNYRYAKEFAKDAVELVKINPRDVVSVPTDSGDEKLRCCRYRVLDVVAKENESMLFPEALFKTTMLRQEERRAAQSKIRVPKGSWVSEEQKAAARKEHAAKVQPVKKAAAKVAKKAAVKVSKAAPKKVTAVVKSVKAIRPKTYEDFVKKDFENKDYINFGQLKWLAKEWDIKVAAPRAAADYAAALATAAAARRRQIKANKLAKKNLTKVQ